MTWDAYHRRKDLLREILAIADREPGQNTLNDLLNTVDPQRIVLEDEAAALFEIQMAWTQRLRGHLDRLQMEGSDGMTPELVAVDAWVASAADMPGARALLDAHLQSPELTAALAKERSLIAASAGVPIHHPDLRSHGERIIATARAESATVSTHRPESLGDDQHRGLIARLRSVIAA